MRATLLALTALFGLATAAQASVVFTLVNPIYNQVAQGAGASLNLSLIVSDAAVARGTFTLNGPAQGNNGAATPATFTGDVADFVSFTANETVTPTFLFGRVSIRATFTSAGLLGNLTETFFGVGEMSSFSGTSTTASGTFGSDNFGFRCGADACAVLAGQVARVPEPTSLALLLIGAAVTPIRRWRRTK